MAGWKAVWPGECQRGCDKGGNVKSINFKKEVAGTVEQVVAHLTELLKEEGFGVLCRIDLHSKFKEKIGKEIAPVVILGACNPRFGYEAYALNMDTASLLPCNAVVRYVGEGQVCVELARPSAILEVLDDPRLGALACEADEGLKRVLERLEPALIAARGA